MNCAQAPSHRGQIADCFCLLPGIVLLETPRRLPLGLADENLAHECTSDAMNPDTREVDGCAKLAICGAY